MNKYIIVRVNEDSHIGEIRRHLHDSRWAPGTAVVSPHHTSEYEALDRMYRKRFPREVNSELEMEARITFDVTRRLMIDQLEQILASLNHVPNVNSARAPLKNALRMLQAGRRDS